MKELSYKDVISKNQEFDRTIGSNPFRVTVLTNITVDPIKDFLELGLREEGLPAAIDFGNYDNIAQDSVGIGKRDCVIVFWELVNLIPHIHVKIDLFDESSIDQFYNDTVRSIDLVLDGLRDVSLVIWNEYTAASFSHKTVWADRLDELAGKLNGYLKDHLPENVVTVDLNKILLTLGIDRSIDYRMFYRAKSLYALDFFREYSHRVKRLILGAYGKAKKAIVFDLDNTLWKGVLGEDGPNGIDMNPNTATGAVFHEAQSIAKSLSQKGVLIGLCSKNEMGQVIQVLESHPDMTLLRSDISVMRINWQDKATNLREISEELNIGLDSIVFVDDSPIETDLIQSQIPEIHVVEVPLKQLSLYPLIIKELSMFFQAGTNTDEDTRRSQMYVEQAKRRRHQAKFDTLEDFIASLDISVTVSEDDITKVDRIAQLTQKTNQFNLTTKRYTKNDILRLVHKDDASVLSFDVSDKFGDSGITAVLILKFSDHDAGTCDIDTFLMSCRIIGRNIEYAIMNYVVEALKRQGVKRITSSYSRTNKNEQVKDFYDTCQFQVLENMGDTKIFSIDVQDYERKSINYIRMEDGR